MGHPKTKRKRRPDLSACIQTLQQSLTRDILATKSAKDIGEVYLAALGLLYNLRLDQNTIYDCRKQHVAKGHDAGIPFPQAKSIPAMTAVIHNQSLFQGLVSCLKTSTSSSTDAFDANSSSAASSSQLVNSLYTPGPRKRAQSVDLTLTPAISEGVSNKSMKLAHGQSPQVGKRPLSYYAKPSFNVRVTAATILYVALEPLDHWPVQLIEAYAEDCFGSRSWVDDPACRLLVRNLALVHSGSDIMNDVQDDNDVGCDADALMVAEHYRTLKEQQHLIHSKAAVADSGSSGTQKYSPGPGDTKRPLSLSSIVASTDGAMPPMAPLLKRKRSTSTESEARSKSPTSSPLTKGKIAEKVTNQSAILAVAAKTKPASARESSVENGDESDSGDEEEVAVTASFSKPSAEGGDSSSSSGEDEEVLLDERSVDGSEIACGDLSPREGSSIFPDLPPPGTKLTFPFQQQKLNFSRVRQRYFGLNLEYSHLAISEKLSERFDIRSKQNSGLLQCLPSFASIPSVRTLITGNLEKWLQSPALSGLARSLFSITVNNMKNADPPLPADLDALDNILHMRLKANQLNAHVENVTAIATRIPTAAVAKQIYGHLLRELLVCIDSAESSAMDHLAMLQAVHGVLPDAICAEGIASSLLTLLLDPPAEVNRISKALLVRRICKLIRMMANKFGSSFDAYLVLNQIMAHRTSDSEIEWSVFDEENKARLMFQCTTLLVTSTFTSERIHPSGKSVKLVGPSTEEVQLLRVKLMNARKLLLRWCCTNYAPLCSSRIVHLNSIQNGSGSKRNDEIVGAGPANYSSVLDGLGDTDFPDWLNIVRCMLFMETSDSPRLNKFLLPDGAVLEDDVGWDEEAKRINYCCDYGADLDDEMIWLVLKAATQDKVIQPEVALLVLEHLFDCCTRDRKPSLVLMDPSIVWNLYMLVEYLPPIINTAQNWMNGAASDVEMKDVVSTAATRSNGDEHCEVNSSGETIARLAYPGLWWRVTGLALIICGASPDIVGAFCWKEHPTLKALIKMVTSDRYRFPTVDCDDAARELQKKTEQEMRDEEARITELLFLPPNKPKKNKEMIDADSFNVGPRASRRQQEKREKMLKKQKEKDEAEAHAEGSRRRRLLKTAQKSIMLWDPKKGPRKPPKESADLIFSVGELFDLPRTFQKCTKPDFVLSTIGSTSRGAIERAYDWLIPIISFLPDTISRLPASASCFLLLRAYGTDGEEQSQLQKLSAPLLEHVHDSLIGEFGESNAIRAFDLLLTDISSHNPDRRRCARKVLQNAIGMEEPQEVDQTFFGSNHSWVRNMIHVPHFRSILCDAVKLLGKAASFERGSNLRYLVLALHRISNYAQDNSIPMNWSFATMLVELISRRPTVLAAALSSFSDLCSLAIHVVLDEFKLYFDKSHENEALDRGSMVQISLCCSPYEATMADGKPANAILPLALLQSSCVLLSIWFGDSENSIATTTIDELLKMLMSSRELLSSDGGGQNEENGKIDGLASARFVESEKSAISVESWVMLAKSRSDFIAKRAALTAPSGFLPRLLLCSGLPRASLVTMVDRLGKLGENSSDRNKIFSQLMVPSACSEWDIGRLGQRKEVSRKLLGRLSAYSRMFVLSELHQGGEMSYAFLEWLSETCQPVDKPTKQKAKKTSAAVTTIYANLGSAGSLLGSIPQNVFCSTDGSDMATLEGDPSEMTDFLSFEDSYVLLPPDLLDDTKAIEKFVGTLFDDNKASILDRWLEENYTQPRLLQRKRKRRKDAAATVAKLGGEEISVLMLQSYTQLERKVEGLASCLVKWIPKLSELRGSPTLWTTLFAKGQKQSFLWEGLVSRCCQTWSHSHCIACREFLLSQGKAEELDLGKVVRFLVTASTFSDVHVESFMDLPVPTEDSAWARSEETVLSATGFALDCLLDTDFEDRLRSRNDPPECVVLLVLIARIGRNQLKVICGAIMERLEDAIGNVRTCLLLCLLRLYAYFPFRMDVGAAVVRSFLKEAVEICSDDWLGWRSPLDDSLEDMLDAALSNNTGPRSAQPLADVAKKHPLLLLRKFDQMALALEKDAAIVDDDPANEKLLGIVTGLSLDGPIQAQVRGAVLNVNVKYWGYNYRESHWFVVLDVISAVPDEVLFGCGVRMGLIQLLGVYMRLVFVHSQLRTSSDRFAKLKAKFSDLLESFKLSNSEGWDGWLATTDSSLPSLGPTRNILMRCGLISHQQAIDHVKNRKGDSSGTGAE